MKVILLKELDSLGEVNTIHKVKDGYARNYLIPQRLAIPATRDAVKAAEKRLKKREEQLEAKRADFEASAKKLSELELEFAVDVGEGGKLFGSITTQDIVDAIKEKSEESIPKRKIQLSQHIKKVGDYIATIKIFKDVVAEIKIKVVGRKPKEKTENPANPAE